jgi:asparagine synthase (glutamine-hydrolysing)
LARIKSYWQVTFDPVENSDKPMQAYLDELIPLLEDAVRLRLLSDVPVGICLSGGIDSTLMALMISRLRADVPAYTIAFENTPADEAQHAGAIARHLGLEHKVLNVSGDQALEFPKIASWYGEPFGDASSIPMYFLSRMIRKYATVALTGDGGDELFGGYHHYRDGMGLWGRNLGFKYQGSGLRGIALGAMGVKRGYVRMQRHTNEALKKKIYSNELQNGLKKAGISDPRQEWLEASRDPLASMQNCDFHVYMTDDVHTKVDRMSMAHALECRSPFMDYRIIEWAAKLPAQVKLSRLGEGKLVLRTLLSKFLPKDLYDRPKQGFTPPWERWCAGEFRNTLRSDWLGLNDRMVKKSAVDALIPPNGNLSPVLSWMAYSHVQWRKNSIHG